MNEYVIITDSSADLSDQMVKELGVEVLPLAFNMGNATYRNWPDNREMDPAKFYKMLREGGLATTSAVNVSEYTFRSGYCSPSSSAAMRAEWQVADRPEEKAITSTSRPACRWGSMQSANSDTFTAEVVALPPSRSSL